MFLTWERVRTGMSNYQLTFLAQFGNLASSASFFYLAQLNLPFTNALSLPHPAFQAPFLSTIMLHLICL